jgi:hypothetical protein
MRRLDLSNRKFGRLTAHWPAGRKMYGKTPRAIWLCSCECGELSLVASVDLLSGHTKSCAIFGQHRSSCSYTYTSWSSMWARCSNPNRSYWKYYGGRGITVCARWKKFENFIADVGERPKGLTLDRINNNGNYEPGNCRWATRKEQLRDHKQDPITGRFLLGKRL